MKIKVNKHKLNIHYRGSLRGGGTQQHAYSYVMHIPTKLSLTSARSNRKQKLQ